MGDFIGFGLSLCSSRNIWSDYFGFFLSDSAKLTQAVEHSGRTYDEIGEMFAEQVILCSSECNVKLNLEKQHK